MRVSAGIDAVRLGKTGNVADLSCIRRHNVAADYTPNEDAI
jgi:hypothetical protein